MISAEAFGAIADELDPQPDEYRDDPVGWIEDRLGEDIWSKQADIAYSVVDHRYTAVQSCHGTGKSYLAARLVCWWLDAHPPGEAFVVTSAPTAPQIEAVLWREIGRAHSKGDLMGYVTSGAVPMWKMGSQGSGGRTGEMIAMGRKPADYSDSERAATAFQGIHARYVLVVLDEAGGIPEWLWNATDSLVTNEASRVLAIGNPDDPASQFAKVCLPGSGWNHIQIGAFDTPAFTDENVPDDLYDLLISKMWVDERAARWGVESPIYTSKVLGLFPEVSEDTLISPTHIRQAQARDLERAVKPRFARFGADIARFGRDETAVYRNDGGRVRVVEVWGKTDTMKTVGKLRALLDPTLDETPMIIDVIGIGSGVYDRLAELDYAVEAFNASERALEPDKFLNRRSELWWSVREAFEEGIVDVEPLEDDDLIAQLTTIKWWINSSGKIVIEPKEKQAKRIGGRSPDRADAFAMTFVKPARWRRALRLDASSLSDNRAKSKQDLTSDLLDVGL